MKTADVYDSDAFRARVAFAAAYISAGRASTRRFDTCFEMSDGDAVAAALVYRARKAPTGKLAAKLFHYLARDSAEECATRLEGQDLDQAASVLRAQARVNFALALVEQADRNARAA